MIICEQVLDYESDCTSGFYLSVRFVREDRSYGTFYYDSSDIEQQVSLETRPVFSNVISSELLLLLLLLVQAPPPLSAVELLTECDVLRA